MGYETFGQSGSHLGEAAEWAGGMKPDLNSLPRNWTFWIWGVGGGHGNAGICSQPGRSFAGDWAPHLPLASEVGGNLMGSLNLWDLCQLVRIESKLRTPTWCQRIAIWNILVLWHRTLHSVPFQTMILHIVKQYNSEAQAWSPFAVLYIDWW